jgi:hypothetical protein
MKKVLMFLVFLSLTSGIAWAGPFGPIDSAVQPGQFSAAIGGMYSDMKWKSSMTVGGASFGDLRTRSVEEFVQAGVGVAPGWEVYARVGGSTMYLREDPSFTFTDGFKVFGGMGLKGLFWNDKTFAVGGVAQANMYSQSKGHDFGGVAGNVVYAESKLKDRYDVAAGLIGQAKVDKLLFYVGPFWYYGHAKITVSIPALALSGNDTVREKTSVGGFFGVGIPIVQKMTLSLEGQMRDRFSAGAIVRYAF